ncbi:MULTISPECIES: phage tail sheath C-terminal domain-containing protein [unclassified Variovorax]|uniref:phage tail sheath C-terminal domain-containing protein n=1 Tax=unclassified Variovorax TaxID=663243 RepID=UPI003ECF4328
MPALVVPGVRVEARFDVLPPLPATSGIVGIVGIVDRQPQAGGLIGVTKTSELRELLGPGTLTSMPEAVHALSNGAGEVVIAPVAGGAPATARLLNGAAEEVVRLRCRSNGAAGNALRAEVRTVLNAANEPVRASVRLFRGGVMLESFADLQVAPGQPDDLFEAINSQSSLVVAVDPGFATVGPRLGTYAFADPPVALNIPEPLPGTRNVLSLAPAANVDPAGLSVRIAAGAAAGTFDVAVFQQGLQEEFVGLVMDPDNTRHLPAVLATESRLIRFTALSSRDTNRLPVATAEPVAFADGESPTVAQYLAAIDLLADDTRIDLVLASVEAGRASAEVRQIHQALSAHAVTMADNAAPRIAFGSITAAERSDLAQIREHSALSRNRRFVLVAPPGAEGAVAGLVGRLNPQDSPTFKNVPLFGIAPSKFRDSELNRLLGSTTNLLVVQERAGRGVVVLRGLDTSGDQISVTRVADICIRETKAISENFIGQLNSSEARLALKQQIVATFTRMERAGALVPSTDGTDPAFLVDVYSTQLDFAQGTVRVDIAVRPVRSIDFIYATLRVKN